MAKRSNPPGCDRAYRALREGASPRDVRDNFGMCYGCQDGKVPPCLRQAQEYLRDLREAAL